MTLRKLTLSEEDREKFGGPEVLDTDAALAWLNDLGYDELVAIEKQIRPELGMVLLTFMADEVLTGSLVAFRGLAWLALRHAGEEIALADFKPDVLQMRRVRDAADAGPPSGGAASSPASTTTKKPRAGRTSPGSTEASTPGPDAPTA